MYGADKLKEWERQQRLLEQKRQAIQANQSRLASLRMQSNKPAPKQSFFNKVRDTFDANTPADQYRREQKGQARLYADQQKDMGRTRISNNPFQRTTNTVRSLAETIKQPYESLGTGISTAFGEGRSLRDYEAQTQQENLAHVENLRKQLASPSTSLQDRAILRSKIGIASNAAQNSYNRQIAQTRLLEQQADPLKQAGNIVQIGTDLAGLGVAGFAGKEFGTNTAKLGFKQAAKKALPAIGQNAAINTIQGGAGELQSNDPTVAGALRKAAVGGAVGTLTDLTLGGFAALPSHRAYKNVVKELANETDGQVVRDTIKQIANDLPEETIDDISKQITKATDEATVDGVLRKAALEEGKLTNPVRPTFEKLEQVPASHILDDINNPLGEEYLYRPTKSGAPIEKTPTGKIYIVPKTNSTDVTKLTDKDLEYFGKQGYTAITDKFGNTRQIAPVASDGVKKLDSLNPTGGVYVDYTPKTRATMPLADNMTTLDKTAGKAPDELVTIYRGAPSNQKSINAGDFITTNKELAKSYTGDGNVLEMKVPASHILDDKTSPLGEEYLYRPTQSQPPKSTRTIEKSPFQSDLEKAGFGARDEFKKIPVKKPKPTDNPLESLKQEASVFRSEAPNRYGVGQAELGSGLYTGSKEIAGRTADGKVVTDGLFEYKVNPKAKILDSGSDVFRSIDSRASADPSLKGLDGRAWQQRKADIVADLVKQQGYDGVRRGSNQVVAMSDKALIPVSKNAPVYTQTQPPKSTFEQNLEQAQIQPTAPIVSKQAPDADIQANQVIVPEATDVQPVTVPGVNRVNEVPGSNQVESDRIADALGIPKADRTPTADAQVAGRVEMAMAKGLSGDMTPQQIKAELRARNGNKPTTARSLKEKPAKQTFEEVTKEYQGNTGAARIDRQATIADLNKRYTLSDEDKINAILAIDSPSVKPANNVVAQFVDEYKQLTDSAYKAYTDKGMKMGFVDSYLPRIYENPETGQMLDRAEFELLQQGSKRTRGREADRVAVEWLVDKDPTKLLERYYTSMDNAAAGKAYLTKLQDNGLVIASSESVPGLRPVVAEGLQAGDGMVYYAQKDVANKLNELFGSKEANNIVEAALDKAKGVNSLFQSVVLSGGVPNTPLNAFGVMQVLKETMALHPYKAGKAMIAGLNKGFADRLFTEKKDILKLMAQNDIDVRIDLTQTSKTGRARIKGAIDESGAGGGINQAWNEFTNESTFGRFMPALEVLHFESIYNAARKRRASVADASAIAAESTKNFYGKTSAYKQAIRSKAVDDAAGAFLFAPRFRESMLNFWAKNAKAVAPQNWGKVAYRDNQKFLAASALTFAAMTQLNEALNGVQMWDNPDGKKDKLIIPVDALDKMGINTNGKDVAIPFLPSLSTVPRNIAMGAYNFATGKDEEGWKNIKSFGSIPISLGMDVATNEDYFGQKIVEDGATPVERRLQQGTYIAKNAMQPWIREGLNIAGQNLPESVKGKLGIKEKSGVEASSNALELPFRFYDPKYYNYDKQFAPKGKEGQKFSFAEQRERSKISKEIKDIPGQLGMNKRQKAAYDKLNAVEFNKDGTLKEDSNPFYKVQRYSDLQDDVVFEGIKQRANLNAKLDGKPIDPIFDDSITPEQRRVLLWKKTLPEGTTDPTVKKLYEQDWYQDYRNKESDYHEKKKVWNKEMGYKEPPQSTNPYPKAPPELQKSMDYYFTLPKGTGARSAWIKANGGTWNQMVGYWEAKDAWTNGERAKVGLGPVDDEETSGGKGYGKFGYSKKGGSKGGSGSGGSKKEKTPKTYITELLGNVPNISSDEIAIRTAPKRAKFKVKTPGGKGRNYKKIKLG